jgi:hypothetical protein
MGQNNHDARQDDFQEMISGTVEPRHEDLAAVIAVIKHSNHTLRS